MPKSKSVRGTSGTKARVSRAGLKELIGGHAKVGRARTTKVRAMPWEECDPDASTDKAMNYRTNAYERALLRYVAGLRQQSVQQTMRELLRVALLAEAEG